MGTRTVTCCALTAAGRAGGSASRIEAQGWVFTDEIGRPLSPGCLTRTFNRLVEESGLPPVRLHDLRHGAATLMLLEGRRA